MIINHTRLTVAVLGLVLLLATCQRTREVQPLDDYYEYLRTKAVTLKLLHNSKTEVILTVDIDSLLFSATAVDQQQKDIPNTIYTYWVNGKQLPMNAFLPDKEGEYKIEAKLGSKVSNSIIIKAIDPRQYVRTVKLKIGFSRGELIADNLSQVDLNAELLDASSQRVSFKYRNFLTFYVNDQVYNDTIFRTNKPGNFSFKVRAFGKESESITVKALTLTEASIITLPIIFHLFNVDIPQAKLQAHIDILNKTFRDSWNPNMYQKDDRHADFRLQFRLADIDPEGKPMPIPGRDYIDAGKKQYHSDETMGDLGWQHYWNPNYYINAFVADYSNDVYLGVKWGGAGSYPAVSQPLEGISKLSKGALPAFLYAMHIRHFVVDNPKDYPTVLTHEIGHMLALYHTFNAADCTNDSDYCEDTYVYNREVQIPSKSWNVRTCTGQEAYPTNYMDYHIINNSFTLDQLARAQHVIKHGLWLPTPFNGRSMSGGRQSAAPGYVKRPAVITNVKPVACLLPPNLSKELRRGQTPTKLHL